MVMLVAVGLVGMHQLIANAQEPAHQSAHAMTATHEHPLHAADGPSPSSQTTTGCEEMAPCVAVMGEGLVLPVAPDNPLTAEPTAHVTTQAPASARASGDPPDLIDLSVSRT
jgi:hypothetical protein